MRDGSQENSRRKTYFDTMLFRQLWQSGFSFVHSILLLLTYTYEEQSLLPGYTLLHLLVTLSKTFVMVALTFCPSCS